MAAAAAAFGAGGNLIPNPEFRTGADGKPVSWSRWSPRAGIEPQFGTAPSEAGNLLSIRASRFEMYGKWVAVAPVEGGRYYRFEALHRARGVASEDVSVAVMLSWCRDEAGKTPVQRDYADRVAQDGGWRKTYRTLRAPDSARSVTVELILRWTAGGSVEWRNPLLEEVDPPRQRLVRVATTHIQVQAPASIESNMRTMAGILDKAGAEKPDIICLSENFADRGVQLPLLERAQPIPGPITAMLSGKAKQYRAYVAASLLERDGGLAHVTAVLIDRGGKIVGKYRKVHLPTAEGEDGITPGTEYPVFDTDFGRIGIAICWDNWFIEPARILRLKGAEMILFPIAGDGDARHWDIMSRARAIDNGVYVVSSNTVGGPSRIIDPNGEVLAEATGPFSVGVAEVNLDKESRLRWLSVGPYDGEGKSLYIKERRSDTYAPLVDGAR